MTLGTALSETLAALSAWMNVSNQGSGRSTTLKKRLMMENKHTSSHIELGNELVCESVCVCVEGTE
jgi:Tfp pilus assembly ATPase PilU